MGIETKVFPEHEGLEFVKYESFDQIEKDKFKELAEDGFAKKLVNDYFTYADPKYIIIAVDKESGAYLSMIVPVVIPHTSNSEIIYLDKIVTKKKLQGNGLGKKMWEILDGDSKKTIWRASHQNPENKNYLKHCSGHQKMDEWIIYWNGLSPGELETGIKYALNRKPTLL